MHATWRLVVAVVVEGQNAQGVLLQEWLVPTVGGYGVLASLNYNYYYHYNKTMWCLCALVSVCIKVPNIVVAAIRVIHRCHGHWCAWCV